MSKHNILTPEEVRHAVRREQGVTKVTYSDGNGVHVDGEQSPR